MAKMIRKIAKKYGISKIGKIERVGIKSSNELYKVNSAEKKFLIKKITSPYVTEENVRAQVDIAVHLKKKKIPVILPIKNEKGDYVTVYYRKVYLLYPYINIEETKDIHFSTAAGMLRKFHKAMRDYKPRYKFHTKPIHTAVSDITNFTVYDKRLRREPVIKKLRNNNSGFARKIKGDSELIRESIGYVIKNLKKAKFTEKTLLHYDYNKDNLFFSGGKLVALSDFDYSHIGYVEADVAKAAKYWSEKDGKIDYNKFKEFIRQYHGKKDIEWEKYHMLAVYLVLRRIIHAAQFTLDRIKNLEYLYDYDIRLLRQLMKKDFTF